MSATEPVSADASAVRAGRGRGAGAGTGVWQGDSGCVFLHRSQSRKVSSAHLALRHAARPTPRPRLRGNSLASPAVRGMFHA